MERLSINSLEKSDWLQILKVDNGYVEFKIDTGAQANIIPISVLKISKEVQ